MAFLQRLGARVARVGVRQLSVSAPVCGAPPAKPVSREELMVQWTEYFDSDLCDYFYYRQGAVAVMGDDFIADPKVYQVNMKFLVKILIWAVVGSDNQLKLFLLFAPKEVLF